MRRLGMVLFVSAVLAAVVAGPSAAVYPVPDGAVNLQMNQGWFDDVVAWFIATDTNDISIAASSGMTLAPKLSNTLPPNSTAQPVYWPTNAFPPRVVFSTAPGEIEYSGIWQVFFVTWKPGFGRPITNAQPASMMNPTGLPDASEADTVETNTVVDLPIVALHRLAGPFLPKPPPFYRIPQAIHHDPRGRRITLPTWDTYTFDPISRRVSVRPVIITDVRDQGLADELGANLAPGLLNAPDPGTPNMYVYDDPKPITQLPVYPDSPNGRGVRNTNFEYDPLRRLIVVDRQDLPQSTTIQTEIVQLQLQGLGVIQIRADFQRMNAPMLPLQRNNEQ